MAETHYKFPKQTIRDIPVHDKRILLRADFNVPLDDKGEVASDFRIIQTLPTITYLLQRNCTLVIMAHLGRPDGKVEAKYSLAPVAKYLQKLLPDNKVVFANDCIDDAAWQACKSAKPGTVVVLENLRFHPEEEENDAAFAQSLKRVSGADYFVQDGFGVVHRAHASTSAIAHILPAVAGLLLEKEVVALETAIQHPKHPLVVVIGGAKISDKIGFIERLLPLANKVLIGGAMADTFLEAEGIAIGDSLYEKGEESEVKRIYRLAKSEQIVLPVDVAVATTVDKTATRRECMVGEVGKDDHILDVGAKTMELFTGYINEAATVIWNGPLGYAELPQFAISSASLAQALSNQHHSLTSVVGGGDTADFVLDWQVAHPKTHFSHISTGGGASLELMSGLKLPGIEVLIDK